MRGSASGRPSKSRRKKATRGSSRGVPIGTPEPGPLAEHVVEPGRPVALDPPRQDLFLPDRRGRGEPLELLQDQSRQTPGLRPASPDERAAAAAGNRRRPRGQRPGSHGAAPPRSPAASRPGFPAPPSASQVRGIRIAHANDFPFLGPAFEQLGRLDRRDRIAGGQVGQADQGMSLQEPPHNRRSRLVVGAATQRRTPRR